MANDFAAALDVLKERVKAYCNCALVEGCFEQCRKCQAIDLYDDYARAAEAELLYDCEHAAHCKPTKTGLLSDGCGCGFFNAMRTRLDARTAIMENG